MLDLVLLTYLDGGGEGEGPYSGLLIEELEQLELLEESRGGEGDMLNLFLFPTTDDADVLEPAFFGTFCVEDEDIISLLVLTLAGGNEEELNLDFFCILDGDDGDVVFLQILRTFAGGGSNGEELDLVCFAISEGGGSDGDMRVNSGTLDGSDKEALEFGLIRAFAVGDGEGLTLLLALLSRVCNGEKPDSEDL